MSCPTLINPADLCWDSNPEDPMLIDIKHRVTGQVYMKIFVGEAMEAAGKVLVEKHVAECNRSHWIKTWHENTNNKKLQVWKAIST